jgi:high-affinity iron transporter
VLPAFVIGLREGVEASLIVSIVAVFLRQNGRKDALKWVWVGVTGAVIICLAVGIALHVLERTLPQKQQEGLETIVGLVAVAFITYMIVWMRQHAREMRRSLEASVSAALAEGSARGLILMAFLAVLREGFETAVFLVATFQNSTNAQATGTGAVLGVLVAVVIGFLIYRGGISFNLARFFRITGVLLVLVAAGLVASAFHTAHEAGWITVLQKQALDLEWLVRPGTVSSSLVTGMLGIQPRPTVIEVIGWVVYLVPVGVFVLWPSAGRRGKHPASPPPATRQVAS